MSRKIWAAILIVFAAGILWILVWPAIDETLMEIPMTDSISALRNKNVQGMHAGFAPNAMLVVETNEVSVDTVLDMIGPRIRELQNTPAVRFGGYQHIHRAGQTATADFTVYYDIQNDDLPYRSVPARINGHVTLQKSGFFHWKITQIRLEGDIARELLNPENLKTKLQGVAE